MLTVCARVLALLIASALLAAVPAGPAGSAPPDPRWEFYVKDKHRYDSPWYDRAHRIMINFGCTRAPYYSPDSRCRQHWGFHHGIDIAMPCGTKLRAGRRAWVVSNSSLGSAYGVNPIRLRNFRRGWDVVIGHTERVFVEPGDRVRRGMVIARANDSAAPDGCHLHFEKRALRGGLESAVKPRQLLGLRARRWRWTTGCCATS
jgi:murein DD-endopeptidase MepM/ murein hydrolase activator NlpD